MSDSCPKKQPRAPSLPRDDETSWRGRVSYIVLGLASLAWLGLRSGARPSRMVYPCQQAAASNALGFLTYLVALISSMGAYRYARKCLTIGRICLSVCGLTLLVLLQGEVTTFSALVPESPVLPTWDSPGAISDVFAATNVPTPTLSLDGGSVPDGVLPSEALHDHGVDALISLMASQGTHFYKTIHRLNGIFARDDVVVIKVNAQWNCNTGDDNLRSHTNVDVVKGVIYRIVQHPEGFTGAVLVADNGQGVPAQLDCVDYNNAEDPRQSYQDVADAFVSQGYDVCTYTWDDIRNDFVSEYISGSVESGYVLVQDGTPGTDQLSYPKFELTCGSQTFQISMRYGLWNGAIYDNSRLKMINLPVVKRHGMAGATIAVKNYIGFLSTADDDARFGGAAEMHDFFWGFRGGSDYGLLGRQLALIRRADLNVVDAIWVSPVAGWHGADYAVRDNILLASSDPFAVDYYASAYVLVPHITPGSDSAHNADARYHSGDFRGLLMTNENRARSKGMTDIIDLDDSLTLEEEQAQFNVFVADASSLPDMTLSLTAEPVARTVLPGDTAAYVLSVTASEGFTAPVTLTLQGAPSEATAAFDPNPVTPPGIGQLRITTTPSTLAGIYPLTVTGTADGLAATTDLTLIVVSATPSFTLDISPTTRVAELSQTVSYTVTVTGVNGFSEPVMLAVVGLPTGVGAAWSVNPATPDGSSILTLSIPSTPSFGRHPLHVVGVADTQIVSKEVGLILPYPFRFYLPIVLK